MTGDWLSDWVLWWQGLDGAFRFLLLLPAAVALAGLLADGRARR